MTFSLTVVGFIYSLDFTKKLYFFLSFKEKGVKYELKTREKGSVFKTSNAGAYIL